jgi:biotin transport system substrate-specific component
MKQSHTDLRMPTRTVAFCGLFAALMTVGAYFKIPLPAPFVPITLQFFFCLLSGLLLGPKAGALAQIVYVAAGLAGLPVFAQGGGIGYVLQPSFGYLAGFIAASFLIGRLSRLRKDPGIGWLFFSCLMGELLLYTMGFLYLYMIRNWYLASPTPLWVALYSGALVYMPTDTLWCLVGAVLAKRLLPALHARRTA